MILNDLKNLVPVVEKFSPVVAKLLPPPFGTLVSYGLEVLFNAQHGNTQDLIDKINSDPDAAGKIQQFELEHQDLVEKLESSDYQASLLDTQSARERELKSEEITGKFDWVQHTCALIVVIGFFATCFTIEVKKVDQADHDILYMLLGILGTVFTQIYQYYFGSSNKRS